jgi:DNA-binding NarL/FixJ family response regulator
MLTFETEKPITLILADDHEVVRAGLRRLLYINKQIQILDEASNGEDAIELARYHKPDVILIDVLMPRMNGIEAAKILKKEMPEMMVVMLTAFEDSVHLEQALSAGADGYLTKDISAKDLVNSLVMVMQGERVFSKTIVQLMQKSYTGSYTADSTTVTISPREQDVLNLIAQGKTSPEIADILCISVRTVQSHRSNIIQKLNIKSAGGLVRYAVLNQNKPIE